MNTSSICITFCTHARSYVGWNVSEFISMSVVILAPQKIKQSRNTGIKK